MFLLSIKQGEPDWTQAPFGDLDPSPAVQWPLPTLNRLGDVPTYAGSGEADQPTR